MKLNSYYTNERPEMLPYIPENPRRTIEFGCGAGIFSSILKERYGAEVWGVEIDPEAYAEAEKKLDRVLPGDAMDVIKDLPENYFDCLICNDILEHLPDPEKFLHEIRRVMIKGAHITCSVPNVRFWGHFIHYFVHKDWKYADFGILDHTHLRFFTRKSLLRMLSSVGIEVESIGGITPASSFLFNLANILSLGFISDMRYLEYAVKGKFS